MSTLKVNKIRDTAGSADSITLDPNGGAVLAGVTTISTARITTGITTSIQVGGGVTISESGIEASGIGITCANINGSHIGGRRNIIINGAMNVAQRGTSSTSSGYQTVDRHKISFSGLDESPTMSQHTLTSGDTGPYEEGFRYSFQIQNGNQTSGLGSSDEIEYNYRPEAQDLANCGWNYTSSSSFVTLSFWVKSSVAQNFFGYLRTMDGTGQRFAFETGSLTADTWKKVIVKIPGNSNIQFDNDTAEGMRITLCIAAGTDDTDDSVSLETWGAYAGGTRTKDTITTWYTTNDATFEITGLQLEVGPQATAFEHRSFGEEESLCQRYYAQTHSGDRAGYFGIPYTSSGNSYGLATFPVTMRATPTVVLIDGTGATGKATQHGINYFTATASGITKGGFTFVSRPSGDWNNDPQRPISAGYTADAEL